MKIFCPAKINLFLKITGKRSDGFHNLQSLFAFTDLCDVLEVKKNDKLSIEIDGEFAHFLDAKHNLFLQISDYFLENFAIDNNLHIKITKNIPIGGGLGGGSSNAASFMLALNEIFSLNLSKEKLQKISLKFGSDIAFFFEEQAAIVEGRGEIIETYPQFSDLNALLINPKIHLSTKEIFGDFKENYSAEITTKELLKRDVFDLIESLENDLEKPAISKLPIIAEILDNLKKHNAEIAKMSGSGSSCFAIFLDMEKLKKAEKFFKEKYPQFFTRHIKILSHKKV